MDDAEPMVAPSEALGSNVIVGRLGVEDFNPSAPPHSTPAFALDLLAKDQVTSEIAGIFRHPLFKEEGDFLAPEERASTTRTRLGTFARYKEQGLQLGTGQHVLTESMFITDPVLVEEGTV